MYTSFMNNQVPVLWTRVSFASLKSLASWNKDLLFRCSTAHTSGDPKGSDTNSSSDSKRRPRPHDLNASPNPHPNPNLDPNANPLEPTSDRCAR